MSKKAILVHGWEGSPVNAWFPWLKQSLEKDNWQVLALEMPDPNQPKMNKWVEHLDNSIGNFNENYYLVGHSLGCITILRYLEHLHDSNKIGGAVLVAGFTSHLGYDELKSFFQNEIDWSKIKKHCDKFVTIHSNDDPFVSTHYGDLFQKHLQAEVLLEPSMGHFGDDDKATELHSVYHSLKKISR